MQLRCIFHVQNVSILYSMYTLLVYSQYTLFFKLNIKFYVYHTESESFTVNLMIRISLHADDPETMAKLASQVGANFKLPRSDHLRKFKETYRSSIQTTFFIVFSNIDYYVLYTYDNNINYYIFCVMIYNFYFNSIDQTNHAIYLL